MFAYGCHYKNRYFFEAALTKKGIPTKPPLQKQVLSYNDDYDDDNDDDNDDNDNDDDNDDHYDDNDDGDDDDNDDKW